jgi:DNA-binding transcriptional MerR regulator
MLDKSEQPGSAKKQGRSTGAKQKGSPRSPSRSDQSKTKPSNEATQSTEIFDDEAARISLRESTKLYYRIGEVSRLTGVKAHVLRYWETEFRWMAPPKSRSKQRLYRKRDIEFVWLLKRLLWDERYTIAGARQRIQELGVEEALALLDRPTGMAKASRTATDATDAAVVSDGDEAPSKASTQAQWVAFRAALGDMETELIGLRGLLQEGA